MIEQLKNLFKKKQPNDKEVATQRKEPYINIISFELNPANPNQGSFELDWNVYFIEFLRKSGYQGRDDEQIVDQWFQSICRHVVLETYEQAEANTKQFITKNSLGGNRSEIG
jgi:hypothetical protein